MNFTELTLHEDLQKGIAETGYITCTPVQEQVLQAALDGTDLYVQSQTGTGKTAAYLISILQQMLDTPAEQRKKALIMAPTRELAVQIEEETRTLSKFTGLKAASFYGGVGYGQQQQQLQSGVDIIIGTPGRVIDLQESGTMKLDNVGFLVVDEADRMFDMGFYPDLRTLIKVLPSAKNRQTMLFSATLNTYVKNLAWEYTEEAKEITIEAEQITVTEIAQALFHISSEEKMRLLLGILRSEKPESVIVFCNTKKMTEIVSKRLRINGFESEFIIGDLPQSKRLQVIDSFKRGSLSCLVATDVAARGIDVDDLAMVVNFDLPNEAENYVHRIGRTARAGKSGKAYSFCSEQDVYNLPAIEKYVEMSIPSSVASDDLLGEDKSAGMYIRTSRYEDADDDRRGRRDSRPSGRSSGSTGGRFPSGSGKQHGDREGRRDGRRDRDRDAKSTRAPLKGAKPRRGEAYSRVPINAENAEQDLSALSFEERMKVYRQKYSGAEKSAGAQQGEQRRKTPGGKPKGQRPEAGKGAGQVSGQNPRRAQKNQGGVKQQSQKSAAQQQKTAAPEKKPGLLSRIKALFTGKK